MIYSDFSLSPQGQAAVGNDGVKPRVAVVILNFNGRSFLERFLDQVKKSLKGAARLVVADNGSADDSVEYLRREHPDVALICLDRNLGYAGGYNKALGQLEEEYWVLLNSDIEVSRSWLEPLVSFMDQHVTVAACQPKLLDFYHRDRFEYAGASGGFLDVLGFPFCRGRIFQHLETDRGQYNQAIETFWASGACMMVRAAAFRQAGGFDADFFAHMEEIDLCWRLQRLGWKIAVVPASVAYHVGGGTLPRNSPMKTYLNFRNSLFMLAKNLPALWFYALIPIRLGLDWLAMFKFLFSGQASDSAAVLRAHRDFFFRYRSLRRQAPGQRERKQVYGLFRGSIVLQHFAFRRKHFDALPARFTGDSSRGLSE